MRSVLRRLLWLGPTLVLITLVTFGALSAALPDEPEADPLPLFFNPHPGAVERLALHALRRVADAAEPTPEAEQELARLGGAALPFVLPALDSLSPAGRARVVKALRPVGARMGFEIDEHWESSRQVLFWTRFWEEHSIDYRPSFARRAVGRVAQRSTSLRDTEVRQLDTYALDELMSELFPVRNEADVDRVRRLTELAADMTGEDALRLSAGADVAGGRRAASAWMDWWSRNRTRYKIYDGTERITAMLRDTRYGGWVVQATRRKLGLLQNGRPAWDVMREGSLVTLPLLGCGVLGSFAAAALRGVLAGVAQAGWARLLGGIELLRAAFPAVVLAVLLSPLAVHAGQRAGIAVMLMFLAGPPLSALSRASTAEATNGDFIRMLRSLGGSRLQLGMATLRLSSAALLVQLGAQIGSLISLTFVIEYALGLRGLGTQTIEALRQPDLNWLMAITICSASFVGLLHALGEALLNVLDPRSRDAGQELGGLT
jgi:ABC-type dipeptide/oligopeptide/nickel transport system permease component